MSGLHHKVWNNCLATIRDNVSPISFHTWFEPIVPVRLDGKVLTIQVPSPYYYEYLEEQYIELLSSSLRKEVGTEAKLEYKVIMDSRPDASKRWGIVTQPSTNMATVAPKATKGKINGDDEIKSPFVIPGVQKSPFENQLNPTYTFPNFIEGQCNRMARNAALSVCENPGVSSFNPLFIVGSSGLGKTHLSQAIANELREKQPNLNIIYLSAHRFQTQYTDAVSKNSVNNFINFYQTVDVLLIDDIHEFIGKDKTQLTFFHIFNHLHQIQKQLILACDRHPSQMEGMEERLLSRFKWGLTVELQQPDIETRLAILRHKCYQNGIHFTDKIYDYMANNLKNNVRELEGSINSLIAHAVLEKRQITLELAKDVVEKFATKVSKVEINIETIKRAVCDYFTIDTESLKSQSRKREIVQARQISMYFAKKLTNNSLVTIGKVIGDKDHATVLHACKTVTNLIESDKLFRKYVDDIERKLNI